MGAVLLKLALGGWNIAKIVGQAISAFFADLNAQGWIGLVVSVLLGLRMLHFAESARHWQKEDRQHVKALNAELAHEAKIAKQAVDLKTRIDGLTVKITTTLKDQHDAEDSRIAADADAVRLRGPGKAACPGSAVASAAPVRPGETTPAGADAGSQMPASNWAAVPFDWLVTVIEEHDQLLNDVATTKEQHRQLEQAWPKSPAIQAKPAVPYPNGKGN